VNDGRSRVLARGHQPARARADTGDLLRQAAADAGERTALVEVVPPGTPSLSGADRTDRRWTYRELLAEAEQCAHWLLTRFAPGERITVWPSSAAAT
jgi:fatty-acyl-CoA synthase